MGPHEANLTAMHWQPRLVRLTAIGNPDVAGGAPQPCFVDPYSIRLITRGMASWNKETGEPGGQTQYHPRVECTNVWLTSGSIPVLESPEEVARARDLAVGHENPKPKAV